MSQITNQQLESDLNTLMRVESFQDIVPNGMQVEGRTNIKSILCATSATLEIIEQAVQDKYDAIFVHHGWFWPNQDRCIQSYFRTKLKLVLENHINVFAYHLPLDALPKWGNNHPVLCDMGCEDIQIFEGIGYTGYLSNSYESNQFFNQLDEYYQTKGIHVPTRSKKLIKKISILSGEGTSFFQKAIRLSCDAFITGEGTEWIYEMARESGVCYSALGHYKTEEIGPKRMVNYFQNTYGIRANFFASENPF